MLTTRCPVGGAMIIGVITLLLASLAALLVVCSCTSSTAGAAYQAHWEQLSGVNATHCADSDISCVSGVVGPGHGRRFEGLKEFQHADRDWGGGLEPGWSPCWQENISHGSGQSRIKLSDLDLRLFFFSEGMPDVRNMLHVVLTAPTVHERIGRDSSSGRFVWFGGHSPDLFEQLLNIAQAFDGRPLVEFYHAGLIICSRRSAVLGLQMARFHNLWHSHAEYLLANLDSRWLVAASDTIADLSKDPAERAAAVGATLFASTLKMYETEREATQQQGAPLTYSILMPGPIHGLDGMALYWIGGDDMMLNMKNRMHRVLPLELVAPRILLELFNRANRHDTVYRRFAMAHTDPQTKWV